uniref:Lipid phosphate phosphatase gamma-like n=1 Tax=Tanacetum cinerariifolium TaxID=118510 RepID=A0A699JKP1_TANCI|nr:lipid phosphate phosphatase gamma-like [Tanacetum cinerariifolium]
MDFLNPSFHFLRWLRFSFHLSPRAPRQMWLVLGVVWPLAVLTMWSRVYLGYHTVGQVFAGAALGIVVGVVWFKVVNGYIKDVWFLRIEESFIGKWLYIKDTSHIPNLLEFEYENARAARRHPSYKRSE